MGHIINANAPGIYSPCKTYHIAAILSTVKDGDPWGNRTPVCGVRGRRLNRLTNGPFPACFRYACRLHRGTELGQSHSAPFLVHHHGLEPWTH